jgi:hypothetical protein
MNSTTWVFDGTEVKKTGRTAVREVAVPGKSPRQMRLIEITPIDATFDWKKWVAPTELFQIEPLGEKEQ